jgi:hypothetical protein
MVVAGLVKELQVKIERLRAEIEKTRAYEAVLKLDLAAAERLLASEPRRGRRPKPKPQNVPLPLKPLASANNGHNKTAVAIQVIGRAADDGATAEDIWSAFQQHGLKAKKNYVFNITSRLKSKGRIDQRGDRFYLKG